MAAAIQRMSQKATRDPAWVIELGKNVLAYVCRTWDYALHYGPKVVQEEDPDMFRRTPRRNGTVEVLVDASFGVEDEHSVSGLVVLYGGVPIQWESKKQGLIALSTAEAELAALMEGVQAGRSVRALVSLVEDEVELELYNDNRAALILASGQGGGWRTRHLRIRANCLAEAVKEKELSLTHRPGTKLWADALTKCLPAGPLERFRKGIGLYGEKKEIQGGEDDLRETVVKGVAAVAVGGTVLSMRSWLVDRRRWARLVVLSWQEGSWCWSTR